MEFNFNKYDRSKIDSLGTPYDYGSVMHYDSKAFSRNGRPTIVARKPGVGFVSTLIIERLKHIFKGFVSEGFQVSHQFRLEQFAQKDIEYPYLSHRRATELYLDTCGKTFLLAAVSDSSYV